MNSARWMPVFAATFAIGSGGFVCAQTSPTGMHKRKQARDGDAVQCHHR